MKYRLKKEARQFFAESERNNIQDMEYWKRETIHENLLEEVDCVYVEAGIKVGGRKDISGWKSGDGSPESRFDFTVNILDSSNEEYKKINTLELLDTIQSAVNSFVKDFRSKNRI